MGEVCEEGDTVTAKRKPPAPTGPELPGLDPTNDGADERDPLDGRRGTPMECISQSELDEVLEERQRAERVLGPVLGDRIDRGQQSGDGREVLDHERPFALVVDGEPVPLTSKERKAKERNLRDLLARQGRMGREKKDWMDAWKARAGELSTAIADVLSELDEDDKAKGVEP